MVISRSASASGYFLATHRRLVSVSQIFLGSAGPGLNLIVVGDSKQSVEMLQNAAEKRER